MAEQSVPLLLLYCRNSSEFFRCPRCVGQREVEVCRECASKRQQKLFKNRDVQTV